MSINKRVMELRNTTQLKNNALEKNIGIPKGSFDHWSKNDYKPSTDAIIKIAQYFNVSTDYLLGLTDHPEKKEFSQTDNIKSKYQILYENLSHTSQELICKHMANILESEGVNVKELLTIHL